MKALDKLLRRWRSDIALRAAPKKLSHVFDIGCDDGYLLKRVANRSAILDGCDPRLAAQPMTAGSVLLQGCFPSAWEEAGLHRKYDVVFALAVLEHFSEQDLIGAARAIAQMLADTGRLVVTVPAPIVDKILDVLMFLKLIEGQAVEEHHGFDPASLVQIFSDHLNLVSHKTFQLGLNHVFVFKKIAS
ncbi:MAG TPA: methyltransferase domain-containing protein [Bordetella sp.]